MVDGALLDGDTTLPARDFLVCISLLKAAKSADILFQLQNY